MHQIRELTRPFLDVVMIVGSFAHGVLPYIRLFFPNCIKVLVFDVYQEVGHLDLRYLTSDVVVFPLGFGKTADTLCAGKGPELEAFSDSVGDMNARDGAGQAPALGYAAALDLLENSDLMRYVPVTLANDLMNAANGPLAGVNFHYLGTINGATYAGAVTELDFQVSRAIRRATGAVTTSRFYAAGPNVHRGLGDRIPLNAASTLARLTHYVTDPAMDPNAICGFTGFELAGCDRDEDKRRQIFNLALQALCNSALCVELDRVRPNNAINGLLGNIELCEFGIGRALDYETEVGPAIAEAYAAELEEIADAATDEHAIEELELSHRETPQRRLSIDELIAESANLTSEQFIAELCRPAAKQTATVFVSVDAKQKCDIEQLPIRWSRPVESVEEFRNRLQEQRHLEQMLKALEETSESELLEWGMEKEKLIERIKRPFGLLHPHGWDYVRAAWSPKRKTRNKLTRLAHQSRHVVDEEDRVRAELQAVRSGRKTVATVRLASESKLTTLIADLKLTAGKGNAASPLVLPRSLNDSFAALWEAAATPAALDEAVAASVQYVTLTGLQVVTGSGSGDLKKIAQQIVYGGYCVMAPLPWGNSPRNDAGWTTHVLPSVEPSLARAVRDAVRAVDSTANVAFGETCAAGVVAVAVIVRAAAKLSHLFPPSARSALADALSADHPVQFFPQGTDVVEKIGLTFDGRNVSFKS